MIGTTPYLPGLRARCAPLGRRSAARASAAAECLSGLSALFGGFFGDRLVPAKSGSGSRHRQYSRVDVFWAFLSQVLKRGDSCRSAVTRLQALALARGQPRGSDSDSGYCQARAALALRWLQSLFDALEHWFAPRTQGRWCGRAVRIIDGTGFTMPDTPRNRARWPYPSGQKPGCGFPTGKLVGLFCLHTGRLIAFAHDVWMAHDLRLARRLIGFLKPNDVLVADRAYCGFAFLCLLVGKKVDFVFRLHSARKVRPSRKKSWRELFHKNQRHAGLSLWAWRRLPKQLEVRLVRVTVAHRGFRTKKFTVVTSLLDQTAFPDSALAELYAQRWQIELHYRQIKTHLGLDVLRALSPTVIELELCMHALAYNLVRALMLEASLAAGVPIDRLSFKGTVDLLINWVPLVHRKSLRRKLHHALLLRLASDLVPHRPARSEPRAKKRRPKNYQLLTKPRSLMRVSPSRSLK